MSTDTTPNGFPYPNGDDRVSNGDNMIKALAEAVDARLPARAAARLVAPTPVPANGTVNGTWTFPVGRFTVAPIVQMTLEGSSQLRVALSPPTAAAIGYTIRNDSGTAFNNPIVHAEATAAIP